MNRHGVVPASLGATIALVSAGALILLMPRPADVITGQAVTPTPSTQLSYCTGSVTSTLSESLVRVCDPVTVTASITPVCRGCGGGVNVVFLNPLTVTWGKWMQSENTSALDLLEVWQRLGVRVQAAVLRIHYSAIEPMVELTGDRHNVGHG